MHDDGLISLPLPRNGNGRHARHRDPDPQLVLPIDPAPVTGTLAGLGPLRLTMVDSADDSARFNALVAAHHYLGYTPLAGAQLRYLMHTDSAGTRLRRRRMEMRPPRRAYRLGPRHPRPAPAPGRRQRPVPHCPHVHVPHLASAILARAGRRLPADWHARYGYTPVLLETFVETGRFTGASYRAANWIHVRRTKGRGKLDRHHQNALPVKDVYLYPLHPHYRRILTAHD